MCTYLPDWILDYLHFIHSNLGPLVKVQTELLKQRIEQNSHQKLLCSSLGCLCTREHTRKLNGCHSKLSGEPQSEKRRAG